MLWTRRIHKGVLTGGVFFSKEGSPPRIVNSQVNLIEDVFRDKQVTLAEMRQVHSGFLKIDAMKCNMGRNDYCR